MRVPEKKKPKWLWVAGATALVVLLGFWFNQDQPQAVALSELIDNPFTYKDSLVTTTGYVYYIQTITYDDPRSSGNIRVFRLYTAPDAQGDSLSVLDYSNKTKLPTPSEGKTFLPLPWKVTGRIDGTMDTYQMKVQQAVEEPDAP